MQKSTSSLESPAPAPTEQLPPLVVLLGEAARNHDRIDQLLDAGAVIVIAPSEGTVGKWLPRAITDRVARERPRALVKVNGLEIDLAERSARWRDRPLHLTPHELSILATLAKDPGRVRTFSEFLTEVWGGESYLDRDVVHAAVKRLRRKLVRVDADLTIQSVRGVGFRLAAHSRLRRLVRRGRRSRPQGD